MRLTTLFSLIVLSTMTALAGPRQYASNIIGDVNGDGMVTIADVNVVVGDILGGKWNPASDVNNDGLVTIDDVTVLIDKLLTQN